ncbi:MAG: hypothetical protein HGA54_02755 [Actinobacteria bacterium]|nr:hypothetical protein [Actinomycetota bacterium]
MALIVITGGARCGKSFSAEELAKVRSSQGYSVSVAVFGNPDGDDVEFAERIRHHKETRPDEFETLEAFENEDWLSQVDDDKLLVIDCLGTALSSIIAHVGDGFSLSDSIRNPSIDPCEVKFWSMIERIVARKGDTIVVTNEVGNGLVPEFESGRVFRDLLGRGNRYLVNAADAAYFCVCGHLIALKELPTVPLWPED